MGHKFDVQLYYFFNFSARCGWVGAKCRAPAALTPGKSVGTRCEGGWVGTTAGLDWCGKSGLHRDSIPEPSYPYRVPIPTELSRLIFVGLGDLKLYIVKIFCKS